MDDAAVARVLMSRGGSAQQREIMNILRADEADEIPDTCEFAEALLFMFGWGIMSAPNIQWLASTAKLCGANHPDVDNIAGIGAAGLYAGNCRRDLLRAFGGDVRLPQPISIEVPAVDQWLAPVVIEQSILNLPELVEHLYNDHRDQFI